MRNNILCILGTLLLAATVQAESLVTSAKWSLVKESTVAKPSEIIVLPEVKDMPADLKDVARRLPVAGKMFDMALYPNGGTPRYKTTAFVCFDNAAFYVLFKGVKDPDYTLKTHNFKIEEAKIWNDDCYELMLDAFLTRTEYVHFIVNSRGDYYDAVDVQKLVPDPKAASPTDKMAIVEADMKYTSKATTAAGVENNHWWALLRVPWTAYGLSAPPRGSVWGMNLCRANWQNKELSQWKVTAGGFLEPRLFGAIAIGEPRKDISSDIRFPVVGIGANRLEIHCNNRTAKRNAIVTVNVFDGKGALLSSTKVPTEIPKGESMARIAYTIPAIKGATKLRIAAELSEGKSMLASAIKNTTLPGAIELKLKQREVFKSDPAIKGRLRLHIGVTDLTNAILRISLKGATTQSSIDLAKLGGNVLDFALSTKDLKVGEHTLEVSVIIGNNKIDSATTKLWVADTPFGF
jgi:hypothetical protein